jgi:hypothetical protein
MRVFLYVLYALGALDGILLKIRQPTVKEIAQPILYHCRKGFHAFNVQAICDAHKRYTYCAIDMPGSTHDSRAFANSSLALAIGRGCIPDKYYFLGDAAYKGSACILTPYIGNVRADESVFSFYHSSLRMTIEGSFGMLVNKWGILQGPIRLAIRRAPVFIKACMSLHNLIITHDSLGVTQCRQQIKEVMTAMEMKRPTMRTEREKIQALL